MKDGVNLNSEPSAFGQPITMRHDRDPVEQIFIDDELCAILLSAIYNNPPTLAAVFVVGHDQNIGKQDRCIRAKTADRPQSDLQSSRELPAFSRSV
jgi:hypothetical protein